MRRAALALVLLLAAFPAWAAPAFDACIEGGGGTGNLSWVHTPSGTPKGVVVIIGQFVGGTDEITSVTYGGVTMTETASSPLCKATGEPGCAYAYHLGASIPTGAQTVSVTVSGASTKRAASCTITAGANTSVDAVGTINTDSTTNPSGSINTTAGVETFVMAGGFFGDSINANIAPAAAYTEITEDAPGGGGLISIMRKTANPTGGAVTFNWTDSTADDAVALGVAVREGSAAAPVGAKSRMLRGVGF